MPSVCGVRTQNAPLAPVLVGDVLNHGDVSELVHGAPFDVVT
jgi:hypothetical protein